MLVSTRFVLGCGVVLVVAAYGCSAGQGTGTHPDADFLVYDAGMPDVGHDASADSHVGRDGGPSCGTEICNNGLDDNCDDRIDENCPCVAGQTEACTHGTVATRGVGACRDGAASCVDGLEFGTWGDCTGDVLPGTEVCDTGRVDEDCDGAVNEGCECDPSAGTVACGSSVGACVPGTQTCGADGHLGTCMGATGAGTETCNAIDDDCDGMTDESLHQACGSSVGVCRAGTQTCVAGVFDTCVGAVAPGVEDCNGLDDDCDGSVDETLTRGCGSAVGACMAGTQVCGAGTWSSCSGETTPILEVCNNVDDDCDASVDEMLTQACGSSVGICRPGTQACAGAVFGACTGGVTASTETCNGLDDNCNGTADEGCTCTVGMTRACGTDTGVCVAGSQLCSSTGWNACTGSVGPVAETCNRMDDDCDALTDEGGVCVSVPPNATCPAPVTANVLSTVSLTGMGSDPAGGTVTYRWTVTSRPTGSTSNPASPNSASTTFYLDASGSYTLHFCVTNSAAVSTCCDVMITSRPPGALHVELSWSTVYGDVDLHLLDTLRSPDVGWFTVDDNYWANPAPDWGAVGAVANPTLDRDDTDGYGPENITITSSPAAGTYTIATHYYCEHSITRGGGSVSTGDGPTTGTVRVFCDGSLIATYTGITLNRTDDFRDIASVTYPGCVGTSLASRGLTNGSSVLPAGSTVARHCELPCTGASDTSCPAHERCALVGGGGPPRYDCIYAP